MWTGPKVISKDLTIESIQEVTEVMRRPPVIWDNLHANDYDQKRVFLGPYAGRSPELIPMLRGVLTNPNCEFHANQIAIHTLAHWSKCSSDTRINSEIFDLLIIGMSKLLISNFYQFQFKHSSQTQYLRISNWKRKMRREFAVKMHRPVYQKMCITQELR